MTLGSSRGYLSSNSSTSAASPTLRLPPFACHSVLLIYSHSWLLESRMQQTRRYLTRVYDIYAAKRHCCHMLSIRFRILFMTSSMRTFGENEKKFQITKEKKLRKKTVHVGFAGGLLPSRNSTCTSRICGRGTSCSLPIAQKPNENDFRRRPNFFTSHSQLQAPRTVFC